MKNLEDFHKKYKFLIILVLILIPLLVFLPKTGSAFFPLNWSDLNFQMRYQAQWYRVRLENRIEILIPLQIKWGKWARKIPNSCRNGLCPDHQLETGSGSGHRNA